jgi:hypothetical protein
MSLLLSKKQARPGPEPRINERIHDFSTGETCALVIKTLLSRKQNAEPQAKCQQFSLKLDSMWVLWHAISVNTRENIVSLRKAADCKVKYKGKNHETAR